jgi:nitrogen fixation/metabolism regulation signal transduction histidine kinase
MACCKYGGIERFTDVANTYNDMNNLRIWFVVVSCAIVVFIAAIIVRTVANIVKNLI